MTLPVEILKKYWGFNNFRPLQQDIIEKVIQGNDVIGVLPTGSGKSIIYQISGIARNGLTLVISPLIALMEEQAFKLNERGIKAISLTGNLNFSELTRLLDNAAYGQTQFLFLSPERLQNDFILKRLNQMPVKLITIDEAHCISEWGHDFRPSYTKIHILREIFPDVPMLALTATARENVLNDIKTYLKLKQPKLFKTSIIRKNIAYKVIKKTDKLNALTQLLKKDTSAIVYVKTRKKTYQYAGFAKKYGFKTAFFHGGMSFKDKQQALNDWLQNKTMVMFATTAFGMGIDKPDVRQVFHLDFPASLENYIQESGRAGRDGQLSEAILLADESDLNQFENHYLQQVPDINFVHTVYKSLFNHFYLGLYEGANQSYNLNFLEFCRRFKLDPYKTLQVLQILESEEILKTIQTHTFYATIQILVRPEDIRSYIRHKRAGWEVLNILIRSFTDIFQLPVKVSEQKIASKTGLPIHTVKKALTELNKRKILSYQSAGDVFIVQFLENRDENLFLYHQNKIIRRLKLKKAQLKAVYQYVTNTETCRAQFLSQYLGDKPSENCKICDICKAKAQSLTENDIRKKIENILKKKCLKQHELQQHFEQEILEILDWMIEQDIVFFSKDFKYCIKK